MSSNVEQPVFTKTRIIKEDGRYLIYYSFVRSGEEAGSPSGDDDRAGSAPGGESGALVDR